MKNPQSQKMNRIWLTAALVFSIISLAISALHAQLLPADKIRNDFSALLQRTAVDPRPSIQSFRTDSVLIEKGYFYSEAAEKVPLLIYKPLSNKIKKLPVVICLH